MIIKIITSAIAVFVAIVIHEIAHGYVACFLGDDTAKRNNRLSFNPVNHVDFFGTIVLPVLLFLSKSGFVFGWAKPVPVNYNSLKHGKRDIFLVASAGIAANFILAVISALLLKISLYIPFQTISGVLAMFWLQMVFFNIVLVVFNFLPIPPLDGSKILLSWSDNPKIKHFLDSERAGLIAIIFFAFILPAILQTAGINFNPFAEYIRRTSLTIAGWLI